MAEQGAKRFRSQHSVEDVFVIGKDPMTIRLTFKKSGVLLGFALFAVSMIGTSARAAGCEAVPERTFSDSAFGLHAVQGALRETDELRVPMIRTIILWGEAEPRPGKVLFDQFDKMVKQSQRYGLSRAVVLRPIPYSNNPKERVGVYPRDINRWLRFVQDFVERYDGDGHKDMPGLTTPIKHWQIENEWDWQWKDSAKNYARLVRETSAAIKGADKNAKVILGAFGANTLAVADGVAFKDYIELGKGNKRRKIPREKFIKDKRYKEKRDKIDLVLREAAPYVDIIDVHSYTEDPWDIAPGLCWVRKKMEQLGHTKPIWSLENAGPFFNFTQEKFSESVVQRHLIGFAYGLDKLFWSSLKPTLGWSENYQQLALIDTEGRKTPAFYTYKVLTEKLGDMRNLYPLATREPVSAFRVVRNDGSEVFVVWSNEGAKEWTLPTEARQAKVTHVITSSNQQAPRTELVRSAGGSIVLSVSTPVFVEAEM